MSEERRQAPPEAEIVINGQRLDQAQAMAVRVACTTFQMQVSMADFDVDPLNHAVDRAYGQRISEVLGVMLRRPVP